MTTRSSLVAAAVSAALLTLPLSVLACSTVIVGKNISETGKILIGHNEDNGGRIMNAQYWVPPAKHKAGEMITYEPTAAKIPQVRETLGFYWSQTLDPDGSSFSDGFVNEAGVVIVSNACSNIFDKDQKLKDGGIGYGIRRLMAERAHSAREAVDIAIDLLGKYGYFSEGRTYTIADKNEAWQLAIHKGNTWVARRVKDNEVIYIPNNFMMDKVDATDTENVIVSDYGVFIVNARFEIGSVSKNERGKFVLTKDGVNHVLGDYEQDNLAAFDKMKKLSNDFDGVKFYSIVAFPDSTEINVKSELGFFGHLKDVVPYIKSVNKNPMSAEQRDAVYAALRRENSKNQR